MVSSLIESMLRFTAEGHENVSWNGSYSRQSALTSLLYWNPPPPSQYFEEFPVKESKSLPWGWNVAPLPFFLRLSRIVVNHPSLATFVYALTSFTAMYCQVSRWISFDPSRGNSPSRQASFAVDVCDQGDLQAIDDG
jgi:hypothetical protein